MTWEAIKRDGRENLPGGISPWRRVKVEANLGDLHVTIWLAVVEGRYVAREVCVESVDGQGVTGEALRGVPVARLIRETVEEMSSGGDPGITTQGALRSMHERLSPVEQFLPNVAITYRLGYLAGDKATSWVAEWFEVPQSTAARWVRLARQRGLLGRTEKGKAGI